VKGEEMKWFAALVALWWFLPADFVAVVQDALRGFFGI